MSDTAPQPPPGEREVRQVVLSPMGISLLDRIAALEAQLASLQQANVMARDIANQANQRAEKAERELAEAQACPACHGTGEVLPAGPSDAPVEFCVECVKGLTLTCDFYRKRLGVQKGELAEAQERLAMAVEALEEWLQLAYHLSLSTAAHRERTRADLAAAAEAVAQHTASVERRGAAKFRDAALGFIGYVIASRLENQSDYMAGLAEEINKFAAAIGEEDRVEFGGDGFKVIREARAAELEGA